MNQKFQFKTLFQIAAINKGLLVILEKKTNTSEQLNIFFSEIEPESILEVFQQQFNSPFDIYSTYSSLCSMFDKLATFSTNRLETHNANRVQFLRFVFR